MTRPTVNFPNLPFRDQIWRVQFEDGSPPAHFSTYNGEITDWTDNCPQELKKYGSNFNVYIQRKLGSRGIAFWSLGSNERVGEPTQ